MQPNSDQQNSVPPAQQQPQPGSQPPQRQPRWKHAKLGFKIAVGLFILAPLLAVLILQLFKPSAPTPNVGLRGQVSDSAKKVGAEPESAADMALAMCANNRAFKNAADYSKGNNKIIVALQSLVPDSKGNYDFTSQTLGFRDQTVRASLEPHDTSKASLVACVSRDQEHPANQTCKFEEGALDVYEVTYKLDVFKAKTGERVASRDIPSTSSPYQCPFIAQYDPSTKRLYKLYDQAALEAAIKEAL